MEGVILVFQYIASASIILGYGYFPLIGYSGLASCFELQQYTYQRLPFSMQQVLNSISNTIFLS